MVECLILLTCIFRGVLKVCRSIITSGFIVVTKKKKKLLNRSIEFISNEEKTASTQGLNLSRALKNKSNFENIFSHHLFQDLIAHYKLTIFKTFLAGITSLQNRVHCLTKIIYGLKNQSLQSFPNSLEGFGTYILVCVHA